MGHGMKIFIGLNDHAVKLSTGGLAGDQQALRTTIPTAE